MKTVFTQQAVLLLARERLRQIGEILARRTRRTRTEDAVKFLADKAYAMMNLPADAPAGLVPLAFTHLPEQQLSRYAVLGSLGPSLPAYAALGQPQSGWLADVLHRGNPDENREPVRGRSTSLVLDIWDRVLAQSPSEAVLAKARAYLLGHLCHVATDVIVGPYVNERTWGAWSTGSPLRKPDRDRIEAALDDEVAGRLVGDFVARQDVHWTQAWPAAADIPDQLLTAYAQAVSHTYLTGGRPFGYGEVEDRLRNAPAFDLDAARLRTGYASFLTDFERQWEWTYGQWLGLLAAQFLPILFLPPLAHYLPRGKKRFQETGITDEQKERALYEVVGLPYSVMAFVPLLYTVPIAAFSLKGADVETILGIVLSVLLVAVGILYLVSLREDNDFSMPVRWALLFFVPIILELAYVVFLAGRGGGERNHKLLMAVFLGHIITVACALVFLNIPPSGKALLEGDLGSWGWWLTVILWGATVFGAWCIAARVVMKGMPNVPRSPPGLVRLFDDASLTFDPRAIAPATTPTLAQQQYPSGRRKLFKLWWTGTGDMWARPLRNRIQFSRDGSTIFRTVLGPLAPMTIQELMDEIGRSVTDGGGKVDAAAHYEAERDYELQPGDVLSDGGDDEVTPSDHDVTAALWTKLPTSPTADYTVYHAPRRQVSVLFGRRGAVLPQDDRARIVPGPGKIWMVAGPTNQVRGDATTRFWSFFRVGDAIVAAGSAATVVRITADDTLETNVPLSGLSVVGVGAGDGYSRRAQDRNADTPGAGTISVRRSGYDAAHPTGTGNTPTLHVIGKDVDFGPLFMVGDVIRAYPKGRDQPALAEERTITSLDVPAAGPVLELDTDRPFSADVRDAPFDRVGTASREGFPFLARAENDFLTGDSLMDHAADLAALLCMGAASHLVPSGELTGFTGARLQKVAQVFRDWNLDARRVNEWRMLVAGGAYSEKGGALATPDSLQPQIPGWQMLADQGEEHARGIGWVPLFRRWLDIVRRPGVDSNGLDSRRPGEPPNLHISRGVAFLFDLQDPIL